MADQQIRLFVLAIEPRWLVVDNVPHLILSGTQGSVTDCRYLTPPKMKGKKRRDVDDGPLVMLSVHWDVAILARNMNTTKDESEWEACCFVEANVEPEGVLLYEVDVREASEGPNAPPSRRPFRLLRHAPTNPGEGGTSASARTSPHKSPECTTDQSESSPVGDRDTRSLR